MDNRTRNLSQAVSVDGWIGQFDENGEASVHVDIVFRQGAFGDDPDSLVRFKIALKCAEIILKTPKNKQLRVLPQSVKRTVKKPVGMLTTDRKKKSSVDASIAAKLGLKSSVSAEGRVAYENSEEEGIREERQIGAFLEQHFTTPDNYCAWEIKRDPNGENSYLEGSPWDATESPRLRVKENFSSSQDENTMTVEIRCAREDIEIIDLEEKDPGRWSSFQAKKNRDVNLAAAEQMIKDELMRVGFMEVPDMREKQA